MFSYLFLLILLYVTHRRHNFTLMAVVHSLFSFVLFLTLASSSALFSLTLPSFRKMFPALHGSGGILRESKNVLSMSRLASFMSNLELEVRQKASAPWPSQAGTKSDELSDPVSSERFWSLPASGEHSCAQSTQRARSSAAH